MFYRWCGNVAWYWIALLLGGQISLFCARDQIWKLYVSSLHFTRELRHHQPFKKWRDSSSQTQKHRWQGDLAPCQPPELFPCIALVSQGSRWTLHCHSPILTLSWIDLVNWNWPYLVVTSTAKIPQQHWALLTHEIS